MFTHKNKQYREVTVGPWTSAEEVTLPEATPSNSWGGPKIPMDLWQQILSFLEWSQEATKSESVVHLFLHEERSEWTALVLPQAGYTGMTIRTIDDHPQRDATFARLGKGWTQMGTVHHHCTAGAFQSGTDSSDEVTKEGLHITIGSLSNKANYTIHARTTFRKRMFEANLADWFVLSAPIMEALPGHLWDVALSHVLTKPVKGAFPEWWKENLIKQAPAMTLRPRDWGHTQWGCGQQKIQHHLPKHTLQPREETYYSGVGPWLTDESEDEKFPGTQPGTDDPAADFEESIFEELTALVGTDTGSQLTAIQELSADLHGVLNNEFLLAALEVAADNGMSITDALRSLDALTIDLGEVLQEDPDTDTSSTEKFAQ